MKVVLASESQSRRRAMDLLGIPYEICPAAIDEKAIRDPDPAALTSKLAQAKAWKVAERLDDAIVVSGDAVAEKNGKIFEKPNSVAEAQDFLRELSGGTFRFVTSLAVLNTARRTMLSTTDTLEITFRPLIDREIQDYVNRHPVLQYAGAFDGDGVLRFAERMCGSPTIFTALPVSKLAVFLWEQGVAV
jgi:septum formation protein